MLFVQHNPTNTNNYGYVCVSLRTVMIQAIVYNSMFHSIQTNCTFVDVSLIDGLIGLVL